MAAPKTKPKSMFRRFERVMMGVVMSLFAFILEKMVLRALKKDGVRAPRAIAEPTQITTKGGSIEFDPEL